MLAVATEHGSQGQIPFSDEIQIGRFVVQIEADDERIIHAIRASTDDDLLHHGVSVQDEREVTRVHLRLSVLAAGRHLDMPPSEQAASSFENLELHVSDRENLLVVDRKSIVAIDPVNGKADGQVSPEHIGSAWVIAHRIFYLSVIELLRCYGAYYIHAGCVCEGGKGILVCGASGGGKSTLTYALARSGFSFLSDDGVFLHDDSGYLEIFSFPEKIKLDSRSCSYFEELKHLGNVPGKRELSLKDTGIREFARVASPVALVFPVRSHRPSSEIHPIARHEALVRVLGQSIPVLKPTDVQAHLAILTRLVETCGCFELDAASDFDDIPNLIAGAVGLRV